MPFTGLGVYSVENAGGGTVDISAGLGATGALTFTGGSYSIGASLLAGVNLSGSNPLSGLVRLTEGTDMTFAPGAGAPSTVYVGIDLAAQAGPGEMVAYGYLDILSGSTLDVSYSAPADPTGAYAYSNFIVGGTAGASGQIAVDGEGSLLRASGDGNRVALGLNGGLGTLVITDRGRAEMLSLQAGQSGGVGQVYVSGGSSELVVSSATGRYLADGFIGQSGAAVFGSGGGAGFLGVAGGGSMTVQNVDGETDLPALRFGLDAASYGYGIVTGVGSRLTIAQLGATGDDYVAGAVLNVGEGGQGVLLADNEAGIAVTGDRARVNVGTGQYVNGEPSVTAAESLLQISGGASLSVDSQSYGGSELVDGVLQSDGRGAALVIAGGQQTFGRVIVDGLGSSIRVKSNTSATNDDATGQIIIGNLGTGALNVRNGATVTARNIELGRSLFDSGSLVAAGQGTLTVQSGGSVSIATDAATAYLGLEVADGIGTVGTVTISGAGSELVSSGGAARIRLGQAGDGTLRVENGGSVAALLVEVGGMETGSGAVEVSGVGSTLTVSDDDGRFVLNAGQAGLLRLGDEAGSSGTLSISAGGAVVIRNDVTDNKDQPSLIVGAKTGSTGTVDLAGAGSQLRIEMTGASNDAYAPSSSLYYGPRLRLGERGGQGAVMVRDGAALTLDGENAELWVGEGAAGYTSDQSTLSVTSGGTVSVTSIGGQSAAFAIVGRNEEGRGQLSVSGEGSTFTLTSDNLDNQRADGDVALGAALTIGRFGEGDLVVEAGGKIAINGNDDAFPGLVIGQGTLAGGIAGSGTALVTGPGSEILVTGTNVTGTDETVFGEAGLIAVGLHGDSSGELTVSAGGAVRNSGVNSVTLIAAAQQSVGSVRVTGGDSLLAAGVLLTVGATVDLTDIDGEGLPLIDAELGGTGILEIGAGATVTALKTVVGASGRLEGDGSILSDLGLFGLLAPAGDDSAGVLTVDGALSISDTAQLSFDIMGFAADAADRIEVTGPVAGVLTADMLALDIAAAAFLGEVSQLTLIETDQSIPDTDFTITTPENAVIRIYSEAGTGILLEFLGLNLAGTDDADTIIGSNAGDTIIGSAGADLINGQGGVDVIDFSGSRDAIAVNLARGLALGGLAEGDQLDAIEDLIGTDNADRLIGSDADNSLQGGGGEDVLYGDEGADRLLGSGGADNLFGEQGDDQLFGGSGTDVLEGGAGGDTLRGEGSADSLYGGAGDDKLFGGSGDDRLAGGIGRDTLDGSNGNDILNGGVGGDTLKGGADADYLLGQGGGDVLEGGLGADTLNGGAGVDIFRFLSLSESASDPANADVIEDFRPGTDLIDLSAVDADTTLDGDQEFQLIGPDFFSGSAGELRVIAAPSVVETHVEADVDGDQAADFLLIINGIMTLGADSFEL